LSGILSSVFEDEREASNFATSIKSLTSKEKIVSKCSLHFIACVQSMKSKNRIAATLQHFDHQPEILVGKNVLGTQRGDVVLMCCEPASMRRILAETHMRDALKGKTLISVLGGVRIEDIMAAVLNESDYDHFQSYEYSIVRAVPNVAAFVRSSMTVVQGPLSESVEELVINIFSRVGIIKLVSESAIDIATTICASGPAFFSEIVLGLLDGAKEMGIDSKEAKKMIAMTMKGTADLLIEGQSPEMIREAVITPNGGTAVGMSILNAGRVRASYAEVVRQSTKHNIQKALDLRVAHQ